MNVVSVSARTWALRTIDYTQQQLGRVLNDEEREQIFNDALSRWLDGESLGNQESQGMYYADMFRTWQ